MPFPGRYGQQRLAGGNRKPCGGGRIVAAMGAEQEAKDVRPFLKCAVVCTPVVVHGPGINLLCRAHFFAPDLWVGLRVLFLIFVIYLIVKETRKLMKRKK